MEMEKTYELEVELNYDDLFKWSLSHCTIYPGNPIKLNVSKYNSVTFKKYLLHIIKQKYKVCLEIDSLEADEIFRNFDARYLCMLVHDTEENILPLYGVKKWTSESPLDFYIPNFLEEGEQNENKK